MKVAHATIARARRPGRSATAPAPPTWLRAALRPACVRRPSAPTPHGTTLAAPARPLLRSVPPVSGLIPRIGASNTGSSPTPFCLATAPGPLAADRCLIVRAAPALRPTSDIRLPLSFTRPLRRPEVGPYIPPGQWRLVAQCRYRTKPATLLKREAALFPRSLLFFVRPTRRDCLGDISLSVPGAPNSPRFSDRLAQYPV
jgi:hypothetical protein